MKSQATRFTTRYVMNESNLSVMQCKQKMCEILQLVMDLQNNLRISRFLVLYKVRFRDDTDL